MTLDDLKNRITITNLPCGDGVREFTATLTLDASVKLNEEATAGIPLWKIHDDLKKCLLARILSELYDDRRREIAETVATLLAAMPYFQDDKARDAMNKLIRLAQHFPKTAGWKLVPITPTQEMLDAAWAAAHEEDAAEVWSEMIAAAPEPQDGGI